MGEEPISGRRACQREEPISGEGPVSCREAYQCGLTDRGRLISGGGSFNEWQEPIREADLSEEEEEKKEHISGRGTDEGLISGEGSYHWGRKLSGEAYLLLADQSSSILA